MIGAMQQELISNQAFSTPTRYKILTCLADGQFHSGAEIGNLLNITRAAVWKHIKVLIDNGLDIYSVRGRGYCLDTKIEILAHDKINSYLAASTLNLISTLDLLYEVDSTNNYLFGLMNASNIHGHVVITEYQTKGRGRRNSPWFSPPAAGIYLSIGWRFEESPSDLNCLSLSMGVAVVNALKQFNLSAIGLKWPNDIYSGLKKLGGILVETRSENASHADVIIGVGINVTLSDEVKDMIEQPVTDIASITTQLPSRNYLAASLINEMFGTLSRYQESGFAIDREQWRALDIAREKKVTLAMQGKENIGRVIGIDDNGLLVMSVEGLVKKFVSGQISFKVEQ